MSSITENPPQAIPLTPWQEAFVRLSDHCIRCPKCSAVDAKGWNLNLPCAGRDPLQAEYRQAWRQAATTGERSQA
jgi:hypothetical protein